MTGAGSQCQGAGCEAQGEKKSTSLTSLENQGEEKTAMASSGGV